MSHPAVAPETVAAWGRPSLRVTLAGFVFLLLSGLAVLLLPFSVGAQVLVLAHTVGGVLLTVPLVVYLVPHLARRWRDRWSHRLLLGWVSGVSVLAVWGSGLWLTAQALFGARIGSVLDLVHTVAGCAVVPVLGAHLATAVRSHRERETGYVLRRTAEALAAGLVVTWASWAAAGSWDAPRRRMALPADYGYRYGTNPFTPSLARTDWLFRADTDRRWVKFVEGLLADPTTATDERIAEFLEQAHAAHRGDTLAAERGEVHPDELGGATADGARLASLSQALAAKGAAARRGVLETMLADAKTQAAASRAAFDAQGGIAPDALADSASCGASGCHEQMVAEWAPSAHRYASRSAFFQLIQKAMAEANGAESTRYCAGCHDPIALFSGSKNIYDQDLSSPGADEGVSCASCHSIVRTDVEGNANYTMAAPVRYLAEDSLVGRFLIRAYPRHHKASYGRPVLQTPEFCGACHKQFIDKELNRATRVQLQNQYDSWKGSPWFVADAKNPHRGDPSKTLACRDCHMRRTDSTDPVAGARDGKHRHHGFIAANQWLPEFHRLPGAEKHIRLTEEWLQGKTVVPEIADRWPGGPIVPVTIEAPAEVRAGQPVRLRVSIDNAKVGHTFPTGPLDVIQSWVDLRVTQGEREVYRSGAVDDRGFLQEGAFELKAEGVDRAGHLIDKHNLWDMVGARFRRAVHPGTSDTEEYTFECACEGVPAQRATEQTFTAPAGDDLVVTATLRYRKVNQTLLNMLEPKGTLRSPVTDIASATTRVRVTRAP